MLLHRGAKTNENKRSTKYMMTFNCRTHDPDCDLSGCHATESPRACLGASTGILPSLRVPVTEANRGLLRFLRAVEMAAWEERAL